MATLVQWGPLKFRAESKIIRNIDGFQASLKIKDSDSKCKKEFTEPEEIKFTVLTSLETGGNPIKDYNYLKSFIGANEKGEAKACTLKIQEPFMDKKKVKVRVQVKSGSKKKKAKTKIKTQTEKYYNTRLTAWKGAKFKLQSVNIKDTLMDGKGLIHCAKIELSFIEVPGKDDGSWKKVKQYRKDSLVKKTW